jgi:hypothetical protein
MGAWSYKAGVGVALVAGFALGWSTMVQTADSGHPERLWYLSVLVVGFIGACLTRLKAPRVGCHVVRDGSGVGADLRGATFRCAARRGAKDGNRAWCLRSVVRRVRSAVPAREFGAIEVKPRPISNGLGLSEQRHRALRCSSAKVQYGVHFVIRLGPGSWLFLYAAGLRAVYQQKFRYLGRRAASLQPFVSHEISRWPLARTET